MATAEVNLEVVFRALDLTGVFANALLGGVIARRLRMDPVGFASLAILSGLGGGIIRDTLLQHGTPIALTDYDYMLTALAGAAIAFVAPIGGTWWKRGFPIIDALALGCWATAGAQKTLGVGLGWLPAVLLGVITAVGGGVTRDVVIRRVPAVFGGNTLYATNALAASALMVVFFETGHPVIGSVVATLVGAGLCLLASWRGWQLPQGSPWPAERAAPRDDDQGDETDDQVDETQADS